MKILSIVGPGSNIKLKIKTKNLPPSYCNTLQFYSTHITVPCFCVSINWNVTSTLSVGHICIEAEYCFFANSLHLTIGYICSSSSFCFCIKWKLNQNNGQIESFPTSVGGRTLFLCKHSVKPAALTSQHWSSQHVTQKTWSEYYMTHNIMRQPLEPSS